jgi:hypothetical protein
VEKLKHWTEDSADDFLYKVAADFVRQIENYLDGKPQQELADRLNVTAGRVSQVLNNPGNLTLRKCVEYARAMGKKVAVVAYDDGDSTNTNGPVNAQVFERCWVNAGKPPDLFSLEAATQLQTYLLVPGEYPRLSSVVLSTTKGNTAGSSMAVSRNDGNDANRAPVSIPDRKIMTIDTAGAGASNG